MGRFIRFGGPGLTRGQRTHYEVQTEDSVLVDQITDDGKAIEGIVQIKGVAMRFARYGDVVDVDSEQIVKPADMQDFVDRQMATWVDAPPPPPPAPPVELAIENE